MKRIRVIFLDRYQLIIDGYSFRLQSNPHIEIIGSYLTGETLLADLSNLDFDILICDIDVPVSECNKNPFSILNFLDKFSSIKPEVKVLVISYVDFSQQVRSLIQKGIFGYILKDDHQAIKKLDRIIELVCGGGTFFSKEVQNRLVEQNLDEFLTGRQFEILMLCASQPDEDTRTLANLLEISDSTFRNILSQIYKKLDVRTKTAAIIKARQMGIISPESRMDTRQVF